MGTNDSRDAGTAAMAADGGVTIVAPTLESIQARIFNVSCTFSSCHNLDAHKGDLVLTNGLSRSQLIGRPANNLAARRLGKVLVVPRNPEASFLYQKVTGMGLQLCTPQQMEEDPTCEGERAPSDSERLPEQRIEAIRRWILDGTPETDDGGIETLGTYSLQLQGWPQEFRRRWIRTRVKDSAGRLVGLHNGLLDADGNLTIRVGHILRNSVQYRVDLYVDLDGDGSYSLPDGGTYRDPSWRRLVVGSINGVTESHLATEPFVDISPF